MTNYLENHKFDILILKLRFEDQTSLLRKMTDIDLQVISGFIAIELAFGAWLSQNPIKSNTAQIGLFVVITVFSILVIKVLYNNHKRREEVVGIIQKLNLALGLEKVGFFIPNERINVHTKPRSWFWVYVASVVISTFGISLVMFCT